MDSDSAEDLVRAQARIFFSFTSRSGLYDQVRLLDAAGNELIRINYNNGTPFIVPGDQLQSKADRYYFQEASQMNLGEVYMSPFDLNIENQKLEKPYKPTIRFGRSRLCNKTL